VARVPLQPIPADSESQADWRPYTSGPTFGTFLPLSPISIEPPRRHTPQKKCEGMRHSKDLYDKIKITQEMQTHLVLGQVGFYISNF
jgi:hypothetical protein